MKKNSMRGLVVVSTLAAAAALTATTPAQAQETQGKLGVDGAFVLPTGDWADAAGIGLGGLVAGRYHLSPNLAVGGRAGYIFHLAKEEEIMGTTVSYKMSMIPILVGVNYYFSEYEGPYVGAELGYVSLSSKAEVDGEELASDSNGRFGFTLGAGYEVSNLDLRAQLFSPNFMGREDGEDMQTGIMVNVGYRFVEF